MPHGQRIAEFLLSIGAVRLRPEEPFTWTSGMKSPIYCDNRMMYSHPEARSFVVRALADRVRNLHIEPDVVAGTATAAIGWAALVADRLQLPFVYVRAKAKEHGAGKRIEGDLPPDKHVVVIEDLLSTGGSAASTADALRTEGSAIVTDVVAIFTYDFLAAREKADAARLKLHPLTDIHTLAKVAIQQNRITHEQSEVIAAFVRDPQAWQTGN
jgi:orotate phosphoribosyltransferase